MTAEGKYLYCIIPCSEQRRFAGAPVGRPSGTIETLCHDGLATVVSDCEVKRYDCTRQNMMAHERVLETVLREFNLLPVRFGTVADSSLPGQDIRKLLDKRSAEFRTLLHDLDGKMELGLKVYWRDEKAVFKEIGDEVEVRRMRLALAGRHAVANPDRVQLGEAVKAALDAKRAAEAEDLLGELRPLASSVRENPLLTDRMVLNAAFLVGKDNERAFDQAVRSLDDRWGTRLHLKYVGPVPPYNFVNVIINWGNLA